ncbi:amidohydrolase [Pseudobacteroides cellulosolvens]|uniref:5-methylthioadenosine/S-adenosylhomocysteine deaminase n=1 Tax=Pseudobacteroides cellulosolvens ATCC 35603 = DSM 2933 TaxID=398512 RepID=A0A0L6JR31_9FIRM|nr:amidohydrolase [Pseudobacteroides cellulosolvens]KNY28228.1 5-methylthioadenosine/S-adenosylhomocysteine deaminase [Pseudobacteroides cellulosolvens ATCC 35603 = DSM 2933]
MNILLKNIGIITGGIDNPHIEEGFVGIKDDIIDFVCSADELQPEFKAQKVIDGKNKLVMPGLINTHTHSSMTVMRNYANDLSLHEWLFDNIFPVEACLTGEDIYWGAMLGIAEMIKTGTTTFTDMYLDMNEVARAVIESGIRANLSISPIKFNAQEGNKIIDETSKVYDFYKYWHNKDDGMLIVSLEVHSTYLFNREWLNKSSEIAKDLGIGIQIHIQETKRELLESIEKHGITPSRMCLETGIFDVPVIAAHCVHLTDDDMDILKAKNVSVAHNPTSNLKLGSGIAPIPSLLERGINVTIGTDGAASNNNLNMFEEMHIAALLHKGYKNEPALVNAREAITMATSNGAVANGLGGVTGVIKKGMKADLIIIDMNKPHLCPVNDPIAAVVYSVQGSDVETSIINGKIVMENRVLTIIDEELVMSKVREVAKRVIK